MSEISINIRDRLINKKVNVGLRLSSMLLDHLILCLIITPISILLRNSVSSPNYEIILSLALLLYLCKDSFNGRSLAKRLLNLQVLDNKSGTAANPLQCFVRNLFIFLWPVEVVVSMINPERRMGDRVAGTKIGFYR